MKYLKSIRGSKPFQVIKKLNIIHGPYNREFLDKYFQDAYGILSMKSMIKNIVSHCGGNGSIACRECAFRNEIPVRLAGRCSLANQAEKEIVFRDTPVSYSIRMSDFVEGLNNLRHMCVIDNVSRSGNCKKCYLWHNDLSFLLCNGRSE